MKLKIALSGLLIAAMAYTLAAASSDTDVLLDLLVKKGVLTQQDADQTKKELEAKKKEEEKKQAQESKQYASSTTPKNWLSTSIPGVTLDGILQLEYIHDENGTNTFGEHRARIGIDAQPDDHWEWRIYTEFGGSGCNFISSASLSTSGTLSSNTSQKQYAFLLDAWVRYKFNQLANVQAGQFKIPFSQENLADDRYYDFIDHSQIGCYLVPDRGNGGNGRDLGVQFDGTYAESSERKWVQYAVAVVNGNGIDYSDTNKNKDVVGRVVVYPLKDLSLGASVYRGHETSVGYAHDAEGGEIAYVHDPFFAKAEYIAGVDNTTDRNGWYLEGGYKIIPKVQVALRYDTYDANADKSGYNTDQETVGLNWFINQNAKLQFNYVHQVAQANATAANDLAELQYQYAF